MPILAHMCVSGVLVYGDPCPACQEHAAQQVETALAGVKCKYCNGAGTAFFQESETAMRVVTCKVCEGAGVC